MNRQPPDTEFDVICTVDDRLFYRLQWATLAGVAGLCGVCLAALVWVLRHPR